MVLRRLSISSPETPPIFGFQGQENPKEQNGIGYKNGTTAKRIFCLEEGEPKKSAQEKRSYDFSQLLHKKWWAELDSNQRTLT